MNDKFVSTDMFHEICPQVNCYFLIFEMFVKKVLVKERLEVHYSNNNNIILFYDLHFCTLGLSLQVKMLR